MIGQPGPGARSIRVVPFRHARPLLSGSFMPDPGLGAVRFNQGWVLPGLAHLPILTD
jgi:hypothetical protein